MAYKITKKPDAPEGDIKVSIGMTSFKLKDDAPYETDDLAVVEMVEASFSDFLVVEKIDDGDGETPRQAAKAESDALKELHKTQEKAKIQHVTKDAVEPAAPVPTSLADLREIKEAHEADDSKGGNN
jgi:hypothetical protein